MSLNTCNAPPSRFSYVSATSKTKPPGVGDIDERKNLDVRMKDKEEDKEDKKDPNYCSVCCFGFSNAEVGER